MERRFHDQLNFADAKIAQSLEAVGMQKTIISTIEGCSVNMTDARASLSRLEKELQQWRDYRTLLLIRINMVSPRTSD